MIDWLIDVRLGKDSYDRIKKIYINFIQIKLLLFSEESDFYLYTLLLLIW